MDRTPDITILDPDAVRCGRVQDGGDWIVTTWEFTHQGESMEARIAVAPEQFMSFIVAGLNALDFPEGDLNYLADRFTKEFR